MIDNPELETRRNPQNDRHAKIVRAARTVLALANPMRIAVSEVVCAFPRDSRISESIRPSVLFPPKAGNYLVAQVLICTFCTR